LNDEHALVAEAALQLTLHGSPKPPRKKKTLLHDLTLSKQAGGHPPSCELVRHLFGGAGWNEHNWFLNCVLTLPIKRASVVVCAVMCGATERQS